MLKNLIYSLFKNKKAQSVIDGCDVVVDGRMLQYGDAFFFKPSKVITQHQKNTSVSLTDNTGVDSNTSIDLNSISPCLIDVGHICNP